VPRLFNRRISNCVTGKGLAQRSLTHSRSQPSRQTARHSQVLMIPRHPQGSRYRRADGVYCATVSPLMCRTCPLQITLCQHPDVGLVCRPWSSRLCASTLSKSNKVTEKSNSKLHVLPAELDLTFMVRQSHPHLRPLPEWTAPFWTMGHHRNVTSFPPCDTRRSNELMSGPSYHF
jgi:hypothetical protein